MSGRRGHRRVVVLSEVDRRAAAEREHRPAPEAAAVPPALLPSGPVGDSDQAWGDGPGDNDQRLRENVPPHW